MKKVSVECRNIYLSYGKTDVLKGVNLLVHPGEFFALLGPSGSGKSTLLRLIAGFNRASRGELLVAGKRIDDVPPDARDIGMVFQSYALWPHMSVWDNVAFGLVERRVARGELRERVQKALDLVGLSEFGARRPNQLSGGQQQRVALARTVVIEPQVLLLDEPLSNLDKNLRVQMRQELLALQRRLGITTIFVTHDQEEAMTTADRMAVLDRGIVQQIGSPAELYDLPVNPFVANFVGTMNVLPATVTRRTDAAELLIAGAGVLYAAPDAPGAPEAATGALVLASFRPQHVRVADPGSARDQALAWLGGTVKSSEFLGEMVRYHVSVGDYVVVADQAHEAGRRPIAPTSPVFLGIHPRHIRLLESHD